MKYQELNNKYEREKSKLLLNINELISMLSFSILTFKENDLSKVLSILLIYYLMKKIQILGITKFQLKEKYNHHFLVSKREEIEKLIENNKIPLESILEDKLNRFLVDEEVYLKNKEIKDLKKLIK